MTKLLVWSLTRMAGTITTEVAVVRATRPHRCEGCGKRRVVYALTLTREVLGNPEHPWKCAPCWGLR
jgi:hypothetical protein